MTHPSEKKKINFPPTVVSFNGYHQATITELTDDLATRWKSKHGIDISINAQFGYSQSLLVFTDGSSTFEALLDPIRWPIELKGIEISVKAPRQLPSEYSLIIQQFHKTWNEEEMLNELKRSYVSIIKLARMKMKDGSLLNSVRADFKSKDEVTSILRLGKIKIGSMVQPVKPYFLPIRINKCMKCLQHDHETKTCIRPRLCSKCAEEHPLTNGCPNSEKCINCGGGHPSGHSACPVVQEKRRFLVDQAQKRKSELLVATEQRLHQQATSNQSNSSYINKEAQRASYSQVLMNNQQQGSSLV